MEYLESLGQFRMRPGLERIRGVMKAFGDRHLSFPAVHIGGTNGKGTTAAMVEAILSSLPLRTGLYTSPHLMDVTERLRLQRENIGKEALSRKIGEIMDLLEGAEELEELTYFEMLTAASFLIMADEGVDVNISEVGMGGRWDATNILGPQAVAITSISMDHMDHLGEDPISITREKCGIIKPSTPVVVGNICSKLEEGNRCLRVILDICTQNGCPVIVVSDREHVEENISLLSSYNIPDWRIIEAISEAMGRFTSIDLKVHGPGDIGNAEPMFELIDGTLTGSYTVPLIGKHQAFNLAISASLSLLVLPFALSHSRLRRGDSTALKNLIEGCVEEVTDRFDCSELRRIIQRGLSEIRVQGRAEIIEIDGNEIIVDGCHNLEAARALSDTIKDLFPDRDLHFILAMMKDKHPEDIMEPFQGRISALTLTRLPAERSMTTVDLLNGTLKAGKDIPVIHIREQTDKAIGQWLEGLSEGSLGVALGTFYLYRHIMEFIDHQKV